MDNLEYKDMKSSVTLTNHQWNSLVCYILMTTQYRKQESEGWQELSEEMDENGQPKYPYAKSNAEFYREVDHTLNEIKNAIDNR